MVYLQNTSDGIDRARGTSPGSRRWLPRATLFLGLLLGTMTAVWSYQFTQIWFAAALLDTGITIYFALCLFSLQRRPWIAIPLVAVGLLLPPVFGMAKYQYLLAAATFSDLFELSDLVRHYGSSGWISALAFLMGAIAMVALFCWNFRRPSVKALLIWLPALAFWALIVAKLSLPVAMAGTLPGVPPLGRGLVSMPTPVLFGNWASFLRSALVYADRLPRIARLRSAAEPDFGFLAGTIDGADRRNVYFVVLESFMDPLAIDGARYSSDPFSPLFQSWRKDSGLKGQSPVFGNRSADSEFEALCGLPVTFEGAPVVFPQLNAGQLDCLPQKLARLGWLTEARTIADPRLYNYGITYPKLGFQHRYFEDSIATDDVDEMDVPSAHAVLSFHLDHVHDLLAHGKPFFTYVFGTFGHIPYGLDVSKRPYVIAANSSGVDVTAYANNVHYTSLAVADYVRQILEADPNGLIVAFGDHHPILRDVSAPIIYPGNKLTRQDVPLLIIDGQRGFVPLRGKLPLYDVPGIVADILTKGRFCRENKCAYQDQSALRPLPEALLVTDQETQRTVDCLQSIADPLCKDAGKQTARYQSALATLLGDQ